MSDRPTLQVTPSVISSPASASGPMLYVGPDGRITDPSGQPVAPANLSARQAKALGLMMSGTCGHHSTGSSTSLTLELLLVGRLQAKLLNLGSTLYKLTWKPWVMPSGLLRFRLRGSVRRTSETERTGWVTPTSRDHKDTPGMVAQRDGKERVDQLPRQAYLAGWPTATAQDASRGAKDARPWDTGKPLNQIASLSGWPTPTAQSPNSLRGKGQDPIKRKAQGHAVNLTDAVNYLPPDQPARLTATGEMLTGSYAGMESGGQLSPAHSRWLMGLPKDWDDCAVMAMQ